MILCMKLPIKQFSKKSVRIPRIAQRFWHHSVMSKCKKISLTLRVLSTSPQGNLFTKSIPVSGVPVGGSKIEASIIKYSTFIGFIYKNILTLVTIQNKHLLPLFQTQLIVAYSKILRIFNTVSYLRSLHATSHISSSFPDTLLKFPC